MEQLLECNFQDSQPDHERSAASGPPTSIDQARRSAVPILIAGGLLFMGEGGGGVEYVVSKLLIMMHVCHHITYLRLLHV